MRLAFQFISLINIYAAVPIAHNNSSDGLTNTQARSGGRGVFVYQTTSVQCGYHHWYNFKHECFMRGHNGLATRNEVLEFRQAQEIPIDSSSSWTPVQGINNWMQIGTQSEYIYGSFNRKCDDGVCDTHKFSVSAVTKKEVYCRGGASKDYTFDCHNRDGDKGGFAVFCIVVFSFVFYVVIFCIIYISQNPEQTNNTNCRVSVSTIESNSKPTPTVPTPKPKTTFTSGYSSLPINVDRADFVDFTSPLVSNCPPLKVWFGLTSEKMTYAEGESLCAKYPGLNLATVHGSAEHDKIFSMFRRYGEAGEFCLKNRAQFGSYLNGLHMICNCNCMMNHNGIWLPIMDDTKGFIVCEYRSKVN